MINSPQTFGYGDGLKTANELHQDAQLAQRACEGDAVAKQQVVEKVFDRIWTALSFLSNNASDVDDLVQNALIEVLISLPTYRADSPLCYWAEKIAVRTAAKKFEKHNRRTRLFAKFQQDDSAAQMPSAEDFTADAQLVEVFQRCLDKLSDEQRTAIVAHHIHGYAVNEIAAMCACSVFTIKGRLRRGRKRLKKVVLADPVLSQWVTGELDWPVPWRIQQ